MPLLDLSWPLEHENTVGFSFSDATYFIDDFWLTGQLELDLLGLLAMQLFVRLNVGDLPQWRGPASLLLPSSVVRRQTILCGPAGPDQIEVPLAVIPSAPREKALLEPIYISRGQYAQFVFIFHDLGSISLLQRLNAASPMAKLTLVVALTRKAE